MQVFYFTCFRPLHQGIDEHMWHASHAAKVNMIPRFDAFDCLGGAYVAIFFHFNVLCVILACKYNLFC